MGVYERASVSKLFEKLRLILTTPRASVKDTGELHFTEKIGVSLLTFDGALDDQFVDFKRSLPIESGTLRPTTQLHRTAV
jgi:hypothetical protein